VTKSMAEQQSKRSRSQLEDLRELGAAMQDQMTSDKIMSWCTSDERLTIGVPKLEATLIDDDYRALSPTGTQESNTLSTKMRRKVNFSGEEQPNVPLKQDSQSKKSEYIVHDTNEDNLMFRY